MTSQMVCGFMFSEDLKRVALIRKDHPAWQAGKLNGVGGHIKPEETAYAAMNREFLEEAGYYVLWMQKSWIQYLTLNGHGYSVTFFYTTGPVDELKSITSEQIEIISIENIHMQNKELIPNLAWIIPLALDAQRSITGTGVFRVEAYEPGYGKGILQ